MVFKIFSLQIAELSYKMAGSTMLHSLSAMLPSQNI